MQLIVVIRLRIHERRRGLSTVMGEIDLQALNSSHDQHHFPKNLAGEGDDNKSFAPLTSHLPKQHPVIPVSVISCTHVTDKQKIQGLT